MFDWLFRRRRNSRSRKPLGPIGAQMLETIAALDTLEPTRASLRHYARVGWFLHVWALMEEALNYLIDTLFWLHGAKELKDVPHPISLEQRIIFLKTEAAAIPAFRPFTVRATKLANELAAIKEQRHTIVHAMPFSFFQKGGAIYSKFKATPSGVTLTFETIKHQTMERLADRAMELAAGFAELGLAFSPPQAEVERQHPQRAEEAAQRLADAIRRIAANELGRRQAQSQERRERRRTPRE